MDRPVSDYPFVIRRAADAAFIDHVVALAAQNQDRFKPNPVDPGRRKFWKMADGGDDVLRAKKLELIDKFGIKDWLLDPLFNDLIGYISAGGEVHPHTDPDSPGRMHIRMNLLVGKPVAGCVPLLGGIPIAINLGDAWLCFSGQCRHGTTPVEGDRPRSIVSYGLQVDRTEALPLVMKYRAWEMAYRSRREVRAGA